MYIKGLSKTHVYFQYEGQIPKRTWESTLRRVQIFKNKHDIVGRGKSFDCSHIWRSRYQASEGPCYPPVKLCSSQSSHADKTQRFLINKHQLWLSCSQLWTLEFFIFRYQTLTYLKSGRVALQVWKDIKYERFQLTMVLNGVRRKEFFLCVLLFSVHVLQEWL